MSQNTNTATVANRLEELQKLQDEQKALARALKNQEKLEKWEAETKARNPQYVVGSVRKATSKDEAILGHAHGMVCLIECAKCGKTRILNKQDAKQCRFCKECKKLASREATKARKAEAKLEGKTVEQLEAEIKATRAQLEAKQAQIAKPAKVKAKAKKTKTEQTKAA